MLDQAWIDFFVSMCFLPPFFVHCIQICKNSFATVINYFISVLILPPPNHYFSYVTLKKKKKHHPKQTKPRTFQTVIQIIAAPIYCSLCDRLVIKNIPLYFLCVSHTYIGTWGLSLLIQFYICMDAYRDLCICIVCYSGCLLYFQSQKLLEHMWSNRRVSLVLTSSSSVPCLYSVSSQSVWNLLAPLCKVLSSTTAK